MFLARHAQVLSTTAHAYFVIPALRGFQNLPSYSMLCPREIISKQIFLIGSSPKTKFLQFQVHI